MVKNSFKRVADAAMHSYKNGGIFKHVCLIMLLLIVLKFYCVKWNLIKCIKFQQPQWNLGDAEGK